MADAADLFRLDGKVAIVTGGRGLYGASISAGLAEAGAQVIVASRNGGACEEYAAELRAEGKSAVGMPLDLADDHSIRSFTDQVLEKFGRIDVLVNNAVDRRNMTSIEDATREKLEKSEDVNLNGAILLSKAVIPEMKKNGGGTIVNISSMRGLDCPHFPFYPESMQDQAVNYTTEKWAMVGLTKFMAGKYGRDGIRVNCIAPGGFDPAMEKDPARAPFFETYKEHCPLGRWADVDDIKGPVIFLASRASSYVTGAVLVMDGGWTIW